jgi:hypothetical protein
MFSCASRPHRGRNFPRIASIALALLAFAGCLQPDNRRSAARIYLDTPLRSTERYCAWFGDARDGVLYFGKAAFWSAMRTHGNDPMADLLAEGPVAIGRFDLRRERMLSSLEVGAPGNRSGVWDVLAHPNGRIYFTTFYESAGYVDPSSGQFVRLPDLGLGLNELAFGPDGSLLVSRYGDPGDPHGGGAIVSFDADGGRLAEFPLQAPDDYRVAPKTVAFDPTRREIWATTDLLPIAPGKVPRHDTYVLNEWGEEQLRISEPEIQFVTFAKSGMGYRAEIEDHSLWLRVTAPKDARDGGERILLDGAFEAALDFVQDITLNPDGRAIVTRWSGWVHVVESTHRIRSVRLPQFEDDGLYYSATAQGNQICATYCSQVSVVCRELP